METNQKKADVQDFDRRSATYENSRRQGYIFDRVQRIVLDLAKNGKKPESILDVGCGTGRLLRKAKEYWPDARLIGVDPAEGMIQQATQLLSDAEFHVAMAESLPLPDASVDLVFSTLSFHHWSDQANGVGEIARVLRLQGRFLLADIMMPFGLSLVIRHFKRNNPVKTREMFTQAGLNVEFQQRRWRWSRILVVTGGKKL
ncbi:MAG: class I SAM-dependent methyltransferase [Candidatus Bathyarchaeia archaeon]